MCTSWREDDDKCTFILAARADDAAAQPLRGDHPTPEPELEPEPEPEAEACAAHPCLPFVDTPFQVSTFFRQINCVRGHLRGMGWDACTTTGGGGGGVGLGWRRPRQQDLRWCRYLQLSLFRPVQAGRKVHLVRRRVSRTIACHPRAQQSPSS